MNIYKFKHSNWDIQDYLNDRKAVALQKRDAAAILIAEADIIDREALELQNVLIEVNENDKH